MELDQKKLVSVIMTAYNAEKHVVEAIESVFSQTYNDIELICVNDGSTDKTKEILLSYGERIKYLEHDTNMGIAVGRNTGLAVARREYIAFIDADDIWKPQKLLMQINFLESNPSVDIVFGHMQHFLSPELSEEEKNIRHCPEHPVPATAPSAFFTKKRSFDIVGSFEKKWRVGEFIDWMSRAKTKGLSYNVLPEVLIMRRIHATNTGVTERSSRVDYVRIAREALKRKRSKDISK